MRFSLKTTAKLSLVGFAGLALMGGTMDAAHAWKPSKKLEIVTHVATGSSTYAFAKAVEKSIKKQLKHGVKVTSIRGARGDRARRHLRIKNKGNNHMMQVITPSQVNNPILAEQKTRPWHFEPLAVMVVTPLLFTVNAKESRFGKGPYKSMKQVFDIAKKKPMKLIHGGNSMGTVASLVHIMIEKELGIKMTFTPFESVGITELLGNHIDFIMQNPAQVNNLVKAGRFKILGASEKLGGYPNVKTYAEQGFNFKVLKQYRGLWMPKGVSKEAIKYWMAALQKVRKDKDFVNYVTKNNLTAVWTPRAKLAKMLKEEFDAYWELDHKLNLIGKKIKKMGKKKKKKKKSS
ncbi:MAG: tripartite tricarboxylate transporter substrate-binding protein [Rhodospirillaceae bacterium]|jgi:putative tricarboxylic transport membrane protein